MPTPIECERLQWFPDNWTLVPRQDRMMSDTQRYKQTWNAVTVNVIKYIFEALKNIWLIPDSLYAQAVCAPEWFNKRKERIRTLWINMFLIIWSVQNEVWVLLLRKQLSFTLPNRIRRLSAMNFWNQTMEKDYAQKSHQVLSKKIPNSLVSPNFFYGNRIETNERPISCSIPQNTWLLPPCSSHLFFHDRYI